MGLIVALKILVIIVVVLIFILIAYKTTKALSGGKAFVYVLVELAVFAAIAFGAQWAVGQSFIKVELKNFRTTFPSPGKLALKGSVKNIGKFQATTVTLHVKVVNNASGGLGKSGDSRDQTVEYHVVVARKLGKGITKRFNRNVKYPTYFKLSNIKAHISYN